MTALSRLLVGLLIVTSLAGVAVTTASATAADQSDRCLEPVHAGPPAFDSFDAPRSQPASPPTTLDGPTAEDSLGDAPTDWSVVTVALDDPSVVTDIVGLVPLLAGYSRFGGSDDPLAHETRADIYEAVNEDPGIYVAKLARVTDTPVSTVRYHTRVLVREGLVEQRTERGRSRLVPARQEADLVAVDDGTRRALLVALAERGPATGSDLASHLDLSKSTVSYHLGRLEADGLVERDREGRTVQNALSAAARRSLSVAPEP